MPRKCSVCKHRNRDHIKRAILSAKKSLRVISKQYEVSYSAVQRHKNVHLVPAMQLAKKNGEIKEGKSAFEQFNEMVAAAENKYHSSEGMIQVSWFREWRAMLELAFKLGIEEERRRERQIFKDVTPGVLAIINKVLRSDTPRGAGNNKGTGKEEAKGTTNGRAGFE